MFTRLRALSPNTCVALALAPLVLLMVASITLRSLDLLHGAAWWCLALALIPVAIWGLFFAFFWWFQLDEISQEAHKFAWFWGGSIGLSFAVASILAIQQFRPVGDLVNRLALDIPGWRPGPAGYMVGIFAACAAQLIGYFLVWTLWWAKRMAPR